MRETRSEKSALHAEPRHDRMQPLAPVDLLVEERVEEVEARDPEGDGYSEHPRLPRQLAGDRDPRTDARETVDRSQPEVTRPRVPLEVRVDDEADYRDRPELAHDRVQ